MNILILNGSPAGSASITLQTMEYIKVLNPDHEYEVLHVGQQIRRFEKAFSEAYAALERAELIVFCYPVYTFLAPAQLHRFIEASISRRSSRPSLPLPNTSTIRPRTGISRTTALTCASAASAVSPRTWRTS